MLGSIIDLIRGTIVVGGLVAACYSPVLCGPDSILDHLGDGNPPVSGVREVQTSDART